MYTVLFVCTGNTCRSPMAEVLARDFYSGRELGFDIDFLSRGVSVFSERPAGENAVLAVLVNYGIDLNRHVSRQITEGDLVKSDLTLCMTSAHKAYLARAFPKHMAKVYAFSELSGTGDIADPFMGDLDSYARCAREIRESIIKIDLLEFFRSNGRD